MKRLLVTGRHGFVGNTLANMVEEDPTLGDWRLEPLDAQFDITDSTAVTALVRHSKPDAVLHLAAQSFVPEAFRDPKHTLTVNVFGTLNLLQALVDAGFRGRMLFVSSADVYGTVPEGELPIREARPLAPRNPYAVSKLAAEALCFQWSVTENIDIVIARPFNHIGPGQSERFAVSDFARQVVQIRAGKGAAIVKTGDIEVTRDFTDVRDVVRAYFALLQGGERSEVYNVCSGCERSLRSLLEKLAEIAGVSIDVTRESARIRKSEQRRVVGDAAKVRDITGWQPVVPVEASLSAMIDYWEARQHA